MIKDRLQTLPDKVGIILNKVCYLEVTESLLMGLPYELDRL